MNKEKHFLKAINAGEPNADLIYADWLEEQGRPEADEIKDPVIVALCEWLWNSFNLESRFCFCSWSRSHFGTIFKSSSWTHFLRSFRSCSESESQSRSWSQVRYRSSSRSGSFSQDRRDSDSHSYSV